MAPHDSPSAELSRLEGQLDSFCLETRRAALGDLLAMVARGEVVLPGPSSDVNLHCHSFFSYNAYGYSPTKLAWLGRRAGWAVAGLVDFDVWDGLEEFLGAAQQLGLKGCAGMETRVFVPGFAEYVMNSPGEPGISYHMGVGLPGRPDAAASEFLTDLRATAERRNRELVGRVNRYLAPAALDYDREVLPLAPSGNATERHICLAYARKAHAVLPADELGRFWAEKLSTDAAALDLPEGVKLQGLIRARTMKQGGVGYVVPDHGSFPKLEETNRFLLAAGGIPTHTWLDGTSNGERRIEELLDLEMASGVAAINLIPDRNYGTARSEEKVANLYQVVEVSVARSLLIVVGTEMNSPGQKVVDDFASPELSPLAPEFLTSSHAIYAHSVLQRGSGLGYMSAWAEQHFPTLMVRKCFYSQLGERLQPTQEARLTGLSADVTPQAVIALL